MTLYILIDTADGSMSLHPVARIEGKNFTYINEETNTTLWPGLFKWCLLYRETCIARKILYVTFQMILAFLRQFLWSTL